MHTWTELAERLVSAIERLAAAQEQRQPLSRPRVPRRGLRASKTAPRSEVVVPTDLDRARASRVLKRLGFPVS
jgi:hypothetical protein